MMRFDFDSRREEDETIDAAFRRETVGATERMGKGV